MDGTNFSSLRFPRQTPQKQRWGRDAPRDSFLLMILLLLFSCLFLCLLFFPLVIFFCIFLVTDFYLALSPFQIRRFLFWLFLFPLLSRSLISLYLQFPFVLRSIVSLHFFVPLSTVLYSMFPFLSFVISFRFALQWSIVLNWRWSEALMENGIRIVFSRLPTQTLHRIRGFASANT